MGRNYNFTQRIMIGITSAFRVATNNKKIIKSNLNRKLSARSHCADSHFDSRHLKLVYVKSNVCSYVSEAVVYCIGVFSFINYIKGKKCPWCTSEGWHGWGWKLFKVYLSVQSTAESNKPDRLRQRYNEGIAANKFKESSNNIHWFLFWLKMPKKIMKNCLRYGQQFFEWFDGTAATDLKLSNIMVWIMLHSSVSPCPWCDAQNN